MALTYLNSQMIEIPAFITDLDVRQLSAASLTATNLIAQNIFASNLQIPLLDNVNFWDQTYTVIQSNSANWQDTYINVLNNSANWQDTYTNFVINSPNWNYQGTDLKALSANWQNTFTTIKDVSSQWGLSGDIIPSVTNFLQTNNVNISAISTTHITLLTSQTIPVLSSDNGITGSIKWDSDYLYICINENTWKRVALSAW
jgi:hypothetical protein